MPTGNLTLSDATFSATEMILTGLDSLTSAWGSQMANNTGWLFCVPRTLVSNIQGSASPSGHGTYSQGWMFLTQGSWMIYWHQDNPLGHDYIPYLYFEIMGENGTGTSTKISGGASGGTSAKQGSVVYYVPNDCKVKWFTYYEHTDTFCNLLIQGVKGGVEI